MKSIKTIMHLINRSPSKALDGKAPKEAWSSKPPYYVHLHVLGCEAYVHIPKEKCNKLDPKSRKCIFLGYGDTSEMGC